jgi:hypothetical protein
MNAHSASRGTSSSSASGIAIGLDEVCQHQLVARFLEGIHLHRGLEQGIGDQRRISPHVQTGALLDRDGDIPDRQRLDLGFRVRVELGPIEHRRAVWIMRVEQRPAHQHQVIVSAQSERAGRERNGAVVIAPGRGDGHSRTCLDTESARSISASRNITSPALRSGKRRCP